MRYVHALPPNVDAAMRAFRIKPKRLRLLTARVLGAISAIRRHDDRDRSILNRIDHSYRPLLTIPMINYVVETSILTSSSHVYPHEKQSMQSDGSNSIGGGNPFVSFNDQSWIQILCVAYLNQLIVTAYVDMFLSRTGLSRDQPMDARLVLEDYGHFISSSDNLRSCPSSQNQCQ